MQLLTEGVDPVWWAFALRLAPAAFPQGRDGVMAAMGENGVETRPGFVASSRIPYFQPHALPRCEALDGSVISLPSYAGLSDEQIDYICRTLMDMKK